MIRSIGVFSILLLVISALVGLQVADPRADPASASAPSPFGVAGQPATLADLRQAQNFGATRMPSEAIAPEHLARYSELAVEWLQEYLRIDTTNPPGNEARAASFLKKIFDAEGIENRLIEFAPGRANIWARIRANAPVDPPLQPIILLNHMDVVSSEPTHWKVLPFSGAIRDGSIWGRGAQDMKGDGIAQLLVLVMLQREKPPLARDVIFLGVGDEEVKNTGTDWMISRHRDLLGGAEYLLTEGGENLYESGRTKYVGVDVAEKTPFWLHIVARGRPGHGSRPIEDSAPNRLLRALNRISNHRTELKVLPVVERFLRDMAPYEPPARARRFRNIRQALQDKSFRDLVERDPSLSYMLRNTIAITMLGAAPQTNVIPNEAWANLDVRLLPGEDPLEFLEQLRAVVADRNVSIEPLDGTYIGNSSPIDTPLYDSISRATAYHFGRPPVVPRLMSGYTESQRYRQLGIICYGFSPYSTTAEEGGTEHGDNERIRLDEVRRGYRVLYDVVMHVAAGK